MQCFDSVWHLNGMNKDVTRDKPVSSFKFCSNDFFHSDILWQIVHNFRFANDPYKAISSLILETELAKEENLIYKLTRFCYEGCMRKLQC